MAKKSGEKHVAIPAPNLQVAVFKIRGTAPLVLNRFSEKSARQMREKQEAGSTAKKGAKRDPKDFHQCFKDAQHVSFEGWQGIPTVSFRHAMISACRMVGFQMTRAKLSVFVTPDGYDKVDNMPLVRIRKGEPRHVEHIVRNETGVADIRARPMFDEWEAAVRITFDADQFTVSDVANLLMRAGLQVGIGEGRPDSKNSVGMGWGTFEVVNEEDN